MDELICDVGVSTPHRIGDLIGKRLHTVLDGAA